MTANSRLSWAVFFMLCMIFVVLFVTGGVNLPLAQDSDPTVSDIPVLLSAAEAVVKPETFTVSDTDQIFLQDVPGLAGSVVIALTPDTPCTVVDELNISGVTWYELAVDGQPDTFWISAESLGPDIPVVPIASPESANATPLESFITVTVATATTSEPMSADMSVASLDSAKSETIDPFAIATPVIDLELLNVTAPIVDLTPTVETGDNADRKDERFATSDLLTIATPVAELDPVAVTPVVEPKSLTGSIGTCTLKGLSLRTSPGLSTKIIGKAKSGSKFTLTGSQRLVDDILWYEVEAPKNLLNRTQRNKLSAKDKTAIAWISSKYITVEAPIAPVEQIIPDTVPAPEPVITADTVVSVDSESDNDIVTEDENQSAIMDTALTPLLSADLDTVTTEPTVTVDVVNSADSEVETLAVATPVAEPAPVADVIPVTESDPVTVPPTQEPIADVTPIAEPKSLTGSIGTCTLKGLSLRANPGLSTRVIGKAKNGSKFTLTGGQRLVDDILWYEVEAPKNLLNRAQRNKLSAKDKTAIAWISSKYVTVEAPIEPVVPNTVPAPESVSSTDTVVSVNSESDNDIVDEDENKSAISNTAITPSLSADIDAVMTEPVVTVDVVSSVDSEVETLAVATPIAEPEPVADVIPVTESEPVTVTPTQESIADVTSIAEPKSLTGSIGTCTLNGLSLRASPGLSTKVIGKAKNGSKFTLTGGQRLVGDILWYEVEAPKNLLNRAQRNKLSAKDKTAIAWISSKYVTVEAPIVPIALDTVPAPEPVISADTVVPVDSESDNGIVAENENQSAITNTVITPLLSADLDAVTTEPAVTADVVSSVDSEVETLAVATPIAEPEPVADVIPVTESEPIAVTPTQEPIADATSIAEPKLLTGSTGTCTLKGLSLRASPGLSTKVIGKAKNGSKFTLTGGQRFVDNILWYEVEAPKNLLNRAQRNKLSAKDKTAIAWISSKYLTVEAPIAPIASVVLDTTPVSEPVSSTDTVVPVDSESNNGIVAENENQSAITDTAVTPLLSADLDVVTTEPAVTAAVETQPVSSDFTLEPVPAVPETPPVLIIDRTRETVARCVTDRANLRSIPGFEEDGSKIVGGLKKGDLVLIMGKTVLNDRTWFEVQNPKNPTSPDGVWISGKLLTPIWSNSEQRSPWAQVITQIVKTSGFTPATAQLAFGKPLKTESASMESGKSTVTFQRLIWKNLSLEYLNGHLTNVNVSDGKMSQ